MRIGIMGAGSIGAYVGGKLLYARSADVVLVGRARLRDELAQHGLSVKDFDGAAQHIEPARITVTTDASALADCDAVLCCVKSAQTEEAARAMAAVLQPDAIVVSLQNGVSNPAILREHLPGRPISAGIVGFNVVSLERGLYHRAMSGPLILEEVRAPKWNALITALRSAAIDVEERADIVPDQWTKLLVNLNNAVSALSGAPSREILLSPGYRRIVAALIDEAVSILRAAGIRPAKLRGVPVQVMPFVLRLPTPLMRLVTRAQMRLDPQARSSMWEDLTRRRLTEVDYLNGEIVRLAKRVGMRAPMNERIVELVHTAEKDGTGPPDLDAETFWSKLDRR